MLLNCVLCRLEAEKKKKLVDFLVRGFEYIIIKITRLRTSNIIQRGVDGLVGESDIYVMVIVLGVCSTSFFLP